MKRMSRVTLNDFGGSRFLIALFGLLTCLVAIVQSGEAGKTTTKYSINFRQVSLQFKSN